MKKTERQALEDHRPWKPPKYEDQDVFAIQALAAGTATIEQQKRALTYIVEKVCATYDMSYRPGGPDGDRDTTFAEGRRFVGNHIVFLTKLKIGMRRQT